MRYILLLSTCFSFLGLQASPIDSLQAQSNDSASVRSKLIMDFADDYLNKPYRYGSNGPQSFDCSGFTRYVFGHFGIALPHSSSAMYQRYKSACVPKDSVKQGDLLFFNGSSSSSIGHVAMVYKIEADKIYMIHAARRGVTIDCLNYSDYYKRRFVGAARIL
jgi:cell wall-associated NlpC family hydrolase